MNKSKLNKIITIFVIGSFIIGLLNGRYSFLSKIKTSIEYYAKDMIVGVRRFFHKGEYEYLTNEEIQKLIEEKGGFDEETVSENEIESLGYTMVIHSKIVELYTDKSGALKYIEQTYRDENGDENKAYNYYYEDAGYWYVDRYINGEYQSTAVFDNPGIEDEGTDSCHFTVHSSDVNVIESEIDGKTGYGIDVSFDYDLQGCADGEATYAIIFSEEVSDLIGQESSESTPIQTGRNLKQSADTIMAQSNVSKEELENALKSDQLKILIYHNGELRQSVKLLNN